MKTDTAAPAAEIPGLVLRSYAGEADLPEMVRIQNDEWEADGLGYRETVGDQAAFFGHVSEQFDPARDVTIAEVEGRMVGHARRDWVDANDGVREYRTRGASIRRGGGGASARRCSPMPSGAAAGAGQHARDEPPAVPRHVHRGSQRGRQCARRARRLRAGPLVLRHGAPGPGGRPAGDPPMPDGIEVRPS